MIKYKSITIASFGASPSAMIRSSMANKSKSINKIHMLIFFWFCASHVGATYILNQGDVLNFSASLVSENGLFTLRFGNVSSTLHSINYYLGVWYQGAAYKPFWLANRDRPITDASGALVIDQTGKLLITYSEGAPLELYNQGQSNTKVAAVLLDNGNLVVKEANVGGVVEEQILWQSFDYPTDSFLPGMKLGINLRTGQKWSLTSWLTDSLPTPGAFILDWDPTERQLIAKLRGVVFWSSGILENNKFENIKMLDSGLAEHKFIEVWNEDENYIMYEFVPNQYTPKNWINVTWLLLNYDGAMADQSSSMEVFGLDDCYGSSTDLGCKTLRGPPCREAAVFLKKVVVTDNSTVNSHVNNASLSLSECKNICWNNCGCFGTKSYNLDGTGCVFFDKPLTETANGKQEDVYIIFSFTSGRKGWIWVVTGVAAVIAMGMILVILLLLFMRRRRVRLEYKPY